MFNSNDLVKLIKKAAVEAVTASKPANMMYGKVISVSPLKVKVDQKMTLGTAQLVLSRNVTDYEIPVTLDWVTETGGSDVHIHDIVDRKKMKIHNALTVGETVILMQVAGGQKYIVIDRIGKG